jgi:hypothetical protein
VFTFALSIFDILEKIPIVLPPKIFIIFFFYLDIFLLI